MHLTTEFERPARKAARAGKSAARIARETAKAVTAEQRAFARRSDKHIKAGSAKAAKHVRALRGARDEAADIARNHLRLALESLSQSSEEMSRWAGAKATEARAQAGAMVHQRPLGAVGSMLAVGALLGVVAGLAFRGRSA